MDPVPAPQHDAASKPPASVAAASPAADLGRSGGHLEELLEFVGRRRRPLILTHDNPDPDSLASALALAFLFERRLHLESRIAYGGIIGRAENQAMVKVLRLPLVPVSRVIFDDHDLICLVDTQPGAGNHSLPPRYFPDVVIDHHPLRSGTERAPFHHVGGAYGATSTLVAHYLMASGTVPSTQVATALFYGIKADTRDLGRETVDADVQAYLYLFPLVDKIELGHIEHPALPGAYFQLLHSAIARARIFGPVIATDLGAVYAPDLTAEIAERLLFVEGIRWSLAFGTYRRDLFVSLRTNDLRMNAGQLIREVCVGSGGTSGGHGSMAGARIPIPRGSRSPAAFRRETLQRFLTALGVPPGRRGRRLLQQGRHAPRLLGTANFGTAPTRKQGP
jgi:nanoRNase/pAp phosphatase (c-di-AMP/oligoRNAs hydrolase)